MFRLVLVAAVVAGCGSAQPKTPEERCRAFIRRSCEFAAEYCEQIAFCYVVEPPLAPTTYSSCVEVSSIGECVEKAATSAGCACATEDIDFDNCTLKTENMGCSRGGAVIKSGCYVCGPDGETPEYPCPWQGTNGKTCAGGS